MTVKDLIDNGYENLSVFENPSYDGCIVGISTYNQVVYSLSQMVEWFCKENNCLFDESLEYIDYNTIRTIPYMENPPVIINDL